MVIPAADHPLEIRLRVRAIPFRVAVHSARIVARINREDVANLASVNALIGFLVCLRPAPHKAIHEREIFLLRLLHTLDHRAHAGRIHRHRLLAKDVLARIHRRLDVQRTEARRRREKHHIHAAVDHFLIRVEAVEFPLLGHVKLVRLLLELRLQHLQRRVNLVAENIAHRPQLHVAVRLERLRCRARAAPAAADEADLDLILREVGSAHVFRNDDRRRDRESAGGFQKITTGGVRWRIHGMGF